MPCLCLQLPKPKNSPLLALHILGSQLHAARAYWEVKAQSFRHFVLTKQVAKLPAGPCLSHLVLLQGDEMLSCRCWCAFALSFFIDADKVSELLSPCRASPTPSVLSAGHRAGSSNGLFLVLSPGLPCAPQALAGPAEGPSSGARQGCSSCCLAARAQKGRVPRSWQDSNLRGETPMDF